MTKTAFITGITGQDGAYLAEFLLGKGYEAHGLVRWEAVDTLARLRALGIENQVTLHDGDMIDANNITRLVKEIQPDEVYNLAALSHVAVSFATPASSLNSIAGGTLNILEAMRFLDLKDKTRLYQASSSEMFGSAPPPQNEDTPMHPCSPYGAAKLAAYWLVRTYRDSYGLHASNGILFNHESPLRGEDFVTRKIALGVAAIERGEQEHLKLGNLDAKRDWGHARDYVRGMWMMLQADKPDDYVLATGETRTVREFVEAAFAHIGVTIRWQGSGAKEIGIDDKNGKALVQVDPALFRPKEVDALLGDPSKAKDKLGWAPDVGFHDLVTEMVDAER